MKIPHNSSQRPLSSLARLMECVLQRGESRIGGKFTANAIGNPVDDKSEVGDHVLWGGGGVLVPGTVFLFEIMAAAVG